MGKRRFPRKLYILENVYGPRKSRSRTGSFQINFILLSQRPFAIVRWLNDQREHRGRREQSARKINGIWSIRTAGVRANAREKNRLRRGENSLADVLR